VGKKNERNDGGDWSDGNKKERIMNSKNNNNNKNKVSNIGAGNGNDENNREEDVGDEGGYERIEKKANIIEGDKRIELKRIIITKNKSKGVENFHNIRHIINKYKVSKKFKEDSSKEIGLRHWENKRLMKWCREEEGLYPMEQGVKEFETLCEGLESRDCGVASWIGDKARGLFLKAGYKIRKWAIVGIYGGKITEESGLYVL
jgi:hypothetical protein